MEPGSQVTVVVPTFDRPNYLAECLESIRQQTLRGFRLVVLDNASAADYSPVIERFREMPMTYVRNESNIGAAGNIAKAMRSFSDHKYLVIFHDDDQMHPRMLEWQLDVLERDPDIQFVSTELATFRDGDATAPGPGEDVDLQLEVYNGESDLARSLLEGRSLCFGSTMYRSSVLQQIALDEQRFSIIWDRPFLLNAARVGKSALIRAPLVRYRHHPGQDTNTGQLSARNLIELMKAYREALPANWSRADQRRFYRHSRIFLTNYGYSRLAPEHRPGTVTFLRMSVQSKVLRWCDIRPSGLATMMRSDGMRTLPCIIESALAAKALLSRRRGSDAKPGQLARSEAQREHAHK